MKHVEKQPDFVWEIDCTTSSNVQRARNRQKGSPRISKSGGRSGGTTITRKKIWRNDHETKRWRAVTNKHNSTIGVARIIKIARATQSLQRRRLHQQNLKKKKVALKNV